MEKPGTPAPSFPESLRAACLARGLALTQAAVILGIDYRTLWRYAAGRREPDKFKKRAILDMLRRAEIPDDLPPADRRGRPKLASEKKSP